MKSKHVDHHISLIPSAEKQETIALGGGCFWCIEGVFSTIEGIINTEIGYGGGNHKNPTYQSVTANPDGHAEITILTFNEEIVTLDKILDIFFQIHNPFKTYVINDKKGELYRSVVLYNSEKQKLAVQKYLTIYQNKQDKKLLTELLPFQNFLAAKEKYQNYYQRNPEKPFCKNVIRKKIRGIIKV